MRRFMTWNINKKDSWNNGKQSPPDLDEFLHNVSAKLKKLFSGAGSAKKSGSGRNNKSIYISLIGLFIIVAFLWSIAGFFVVGPAEEAVITRFGKYNKTVEPGLHWIPSVMDKKFVVDVRNVAKITYADSMLTKDENYVSVALAVQYRIINPKNFLFSTVDPIESLRQATASALRQTVGNTDLNGILTTKREEVRHAVQDLLERILKRYSVGLKIIDVLLLPAKPPEEVKAAFDDAIKAQEDEEKYINEAEAYSMGVIPIAKGNAKRILASAEAYKQEQILSAKGEVQKFNAILAEYVKFPFITRERIYLDTIEKVLSEASKVFLDVKEGNQPFLYLPIDKILDKNNASAATNLAKLQSSDYRVASTGNSANHSNNENKSGYGSIRRIGYD